jgi:hypothetical protein
VSWYESLLFVHTVLVGAAAPIVRGSRSVRDAGGHGPWRLVRLQLDE